jgi:hypothetical protein
VLAQYSVLFTQILDHILLPVIHPTGQCDHQELKGIESFHRLVIVSSQFKIQPSHPLDSSFRAIRDTLVQSVRALQVQMQVARTLVSREPERAAETFDHAISMTEGAIAEGRKAIHDLRSQRQSITIWRS